MKEDSHQKYNIVHCILLLFFNAQYFRWPERIFLELACLSIPREEVKLKEVLEHHHCLRDQVR
jgi:hypothetical protein